jgi:hypothetical protein
LILPGIERIENYARVSKAYLEKSYLLNFTFKTWEKPIALYDPIVDGLHHDGDRNNVVAQNVRSSNPAATAVLVYKALRAGSSPAQPVTEGIS